MDFNPNGAGQWFLRLINNCINEETDVAKATNHILAHMEQILETWNLEFCVPFISGAIISLKLCQISSICLLVCNLGNFSGEI